MTGMTILKMMTLTLAFVCSVKAFSTNVIVNDTVVTDYVSPDSDYVVIHDTVENVHSPKKAGWYSAVLPGLGQAYNRKYWKLPVVWGGLAATTYFIIRNVTPMKQSRDAYLWIDNGSVGEPPNEYAEMYGGSLVKLENIYNDYRYKIETFSVLTVLWYALNIVDAVVDAHLMDFDVSDDIAVSIQPYCTISSIQDKNPVSSCVNVVYPPCEWKRYQEIHGITCKINF